MKIINLILLGVLLLTVSCKKEDKTTDAASTGGGGGSQSTPKDLFSTHWSVSNNAWEINLGSGNLNGASFTMYATYSNGNTCSCTATITGTQSAGSYLATSCIATNNASGTNTDTTCSNIFAYTSSGRYTNNNGYLNFCRNVTSNCTLTYH